MSLPGVAELLRPVGPGPVSDLGRQASGREAHPQKITVYLSADELLDLERVRLTLRARGIGVDRGRLVREAIAVLIADLEAGVDASVIARRLRAATEPGPADASPVRSAPADALASAAAAAALAGRALAGGTRAIASSVLGNDIPGGAIPAGAIPAGTVAAGTVAGLPAGLQ